MKKQLAIIKAFNDRDQKLFRIEMVDGRIRMKYVWPNQELAIKASKETRKYYADATGNLVPVQVFYKGKNGKKQQLCGGCATIPKRVERIR